jgi:DnaJ-class molecular chaperone
MTDEHDDETCSDCAGTGWHDEDARIKCGECREPWMGGAEG